MGNHDGPEGAEDTDDTREDGSSWGDQETIVAQPGSGGHVSDVRELPPDSAVHATPDEGRVGRMVLEHVLGAGGMGRVHEASDPALRRSVAVKLMHASHVVDPQMRHRFMHEARIMAQLEHPNIMPIYDVGEDERGVAHIVMRKVGGKSLNHVLEQLRRRDTEALEHWTRLRLLNVFLKVCEAVAFAHSRDVLHRDLKPSNVMIGDYGEVLVLDWGVAHRLDAADPSATPSAGAVVGTPGYMSPEQGMGKRDLDVRSDIWSLGAILYELLTHQPAYKEAKPVQRLVRSIEDRPTSPPERAPQLQIPPELSEICERALAREPDDRFQSVPELAAAIETVLEGSRRREQAAAELRVAERAWERYVAMGDERQTLQAREKRLADAADAWAPLSERQELIDVRDALAELEPRRARAFGEVIGRCEKALAHDPTYPQARARLADAYWERLQEAEQRRETAQIAYYEDRVGAFDDGRYKELLAGTGALTLHTDPPGAEVICERFELRGLVYPTTERHELDTTPLQEVPLLMGSYLLTIRRPGQRDTVYPINISRARHWDSGATPIPLYSDEEIGEGFVYVPAGPYSCGGDRDAPGSKELSEPWVDGFFISRLQVTMAQYLEFLNALHEQDPPEAWRRCPRSETSLGNAEGQYFARPARGERYRLPERDPDGNTWDPTWPVFGISWHDAVAYAAWASKRDGVTYRLPYEDEMEKAARGVDGRFYPWGDGFDRTLCKMGDSRRHRPSPEPVGAFRTDVSVYGVQDLAGSMRDWCGDPDFDGDGTLRPVRGGSWNYDPRFCRAACRLGRPPWRVFAYNGFRLARDEPIRAG